MRSSDRMLDMHRLAAALCLSGVLVAPPTFAEPSFILTFEDLIQRRCDPPTGGRSEADVMRDLGYCIGFFSAVLMQLERDNLACGTRGFPISGFIDLSKSAIKQKPELATKDADFGVHVVIAANFTCR